MTLDWSVGCAAAAGDAELGNASFPLPSTSVFSILDAAYFYGCCSSVVRALCKNGLTAMQAYQFGGVADSCGPK